MSTPQSTPQSKRVHNESSSSNGASGGGVRQNNWIFTSQELHHSPSLRDGIDYMSEIVLRAKGCAFIYQVSAQLRLPPPVVYTATTMLHRFYMRFSLKRYHHYDIAATCIFLATKVEEHTRKLKDIVIACCRAALKKVDLYIDEQNKEFWRWRDTILFDEELLLEALCFDLVLENPYTVLAGFARRFVPNEQHRSPLIKAAWGFLTDSAKTTAALRYPPKVLAAAALFYASHVTKLDLFPDPAVSRAAPLRDWWSDVPVSSEHMRHVCKILVDMSAGPLAKFVWEQKYIEV
ncbi:cyclin [Myxozyma melibiosi]|uniref:Cyclin n=1 Tax=Myxozyma melibiosi TaxID=54550 RepID=A0ABR1F3S3_9ASCO